MPEPEHRRVDVLVLGGGLAALRAAVAARQAGARVAVAVKGKLGRSGGSAMTSGGYAVVLPEDAADDTPARHAEDTLRGGAGLGDPRLVRLLCAEAAERVRELVALGGQFARTGHGYQRAPSGDHAHPRVLLPVHHVGTDLTVPLAQHAAALGVEPLEHTMALELLAADGRVQGALCLDTRGERLLVVQAGAVVLGTGGAGRLFPVTSNPNDVTGDGYALAARAGAELRDMEFIQFYPWRCIDPFDRARVAIQPATFVLGGRLYNRRGERFMGRYDPERWEATTRAVGARAIYDQIRQGLDVRGGVRLDLVALSEEQFRESNPKVWEGLQIKRLDYRTYPFVVAPEAHYFMGGVRIDEHAQSSVAGLFAAGEVAGGIQGANRLDSNSLPETQVFGARAGEAAAALARAGHAAADLARAWAPAVPPREPVARWQALLAAAEAGGGLPLADLRALHGDLQRRMQLSLGIVRDHASMEAGLAHVRELRARLEAQPPTAAGLRAWHELQCLCDVGELCLVAALLRTESRGAHYRDDHPAPDDARWRRAIVLRRDAAGTLAPTLLPVDTPATA
jgi:fumarate reductase (CoM/CoB) subunit A